MKIATLWLSAAWLWTIHLTFLSSFVFVKHQLHFGVLTCMAWRHAARWLRRRVRTSTVTPSHVLRNFITSFLHSLNPARYLSTTLGSMLKDTASKDQAFIWYAAWRQVYQKQFNICPQRACLLESHKMERISQKYSTHATICKKNLEERVRYIFSQNGSRERKIICQPEWRSFTVLNG